MCICVMSADRQHRLSFTWLSSVVPAGHYKLSYRINNELCIFIQHLYPAGRFPNSATNTNAQPLCVSCDTT